MSANAKKEMMELIRQLRKHGIECKQLPNGHWRTDSDPPLTFSYSPSDTNAARAARRDIRKILGIDLRQPVKRKESANDFAMQRLRDRVLPQMERGAYVADLARLSVAESEDKRIGGWPNTNTAEVGISNMLRGNRIVKANHDALAAAVSKLESSDDAAFGKHLDKAAERFGKKRIGKAAPERTPDFPPNVEKPPEPEPEIVVPLPAIPVIDESPERISGHEDLLAGLIAALGKIEVVVKVEVGLDAETRALLGGR